MGWHMNVPDRPRSARPLAAVKREPGRSWYRIVNQAEQDAAEIWLYDEIGEWGVTAGMFVAELTALRAADITLHLNSRGGEVWDGLAIFNALKAHPARVTVQVDGAALSAASFIAQAGDRIVTARQSQWMIHDASGLCLGNAGDMRSMADFLDQNSSMIAEIYHDRAKGGVTKWRNLMRAESWYTAAEAVEVGLADEVAALPKRQEEEALAATAQWDLSVFRHPERAVALAHAVEPTETDEPAPATDPVVPSPAAVVPPPEPVADPAPVWPDLDPVVLRAATARAANLDFDQAGFRDAVAAAGRDVAAPEPARLAFPAPPPDPAPPPVVAPEPTMADRVRAAVDVAAYDAPAPAPTRPAAPASSAAAAPPEAVEPPDRPLTLAEFFRAAVGTAADDVPAPTGPAAAPHEPAPTPGPAIDSAALRRAVREARL